MGNKKLLWLTILTSIALLGLVGVQAYWATKIIQENERKFNSSINESLSNVVRYLEKKDIEGRTFNFFVSVDTPSSAPVLRSQNLQWYSEEDSNITSVVSVSHNSQVVIVDEGDSNQGEEVVVDVQVNSKDKAVYKFVEKIDADVDADLDEKEQNTIVVKRHFEKVREREELINEVWEELIIRKVEIGERLDSVLLDSILKKEIEDRGISIPFLYGVFLDDDSVLLSNFENQVYQKSSFPYTARLFPTDLDLSDSYLGLFFPDKNRFILRESMVAIASSFLFILIIAICFWYLSRLFLSQKKLNELKNDFIDNMTHELKTPLTNINLATQSLQDVDLATDIKSKQNYLDIIEGESQKLLNQVEEVLEVKEEDWSGEKVSISEFDILEVFQKVQQDLELLQEGNNAKIRLNIPEGLKIQWDRQIISKVFLNLLENAIKYGGPKVEILVDGKISGKDYRIAVSDNGPGIKEEFQAMVYDKFFRVPTGNIHDIKGSGLGLSYVKKAIGKMGGKIELKSQEGEGTNFYIHIPGSLIKG